MKPTLSCAPFGDAPDATGVTFEQPLRRRKATHFKQDRRALKACLEPVRVLFGQARPQVQCLRTAALVLRGPGQSGTYIRVIRPALERRMQPPHRRVTPA